MSKIKQILTKQSKLYRKYGLTFVGLFGSGARGGLSVKSDVDILFDYPMNKPPSFFQLAKLKNELEKILGRKVDLVSKKAIKPEFYRYIVNDIQKVYDQK